MYVPPQCSTIKEMTKFLKNNHSKLQKLKDEPKLTPIYDKNLSLDLSELEAKEMDFHYKLGVLYVRDGQTDEDSMFQNSTIPTF